ncbi:MAG: hypothetical protein DRI99_01980 [Candidatus Aminicenantes bacterium]|mgnify:CR=1 FL=1|nr:response regulator [Candidatus Aminicenantes bacterium]RLE04222.1 MAG: hypothetical protein DRJ11_01730 [Candidatus Aminicenantes bacterium]RLE05493.1 MAG: hypothetical protein DRI99_01980 [Candidatus Aminicenantes bacterium]HHF42913.1 response regulator [Candidatus Aminicenantes bacterium]
MMEIERKILLIDPDPRDREILAALLREENYSVETGKSLKEALEKLAQGGFHCLVMEVHLPEMKGYEAVPIIKNLDPNLKIIMMTNKNSRQLEAKVREQDIFYYFIKSFGQEELILAIRNAFSQ